MNKLDVTLATTLLAITAYLLCSANVLTALGIPYSTEGGSFIYKVHPGSYLIYFATTTLGLTAIFVRSKTIPYEPGFIYVVGYCLAITVCGLYALASTGSGNVVIFIDSFLPAGLIAILAGRNQRNFRQYIKPALQMCIFMNSIIALYEWATDNNLVPLYLGSFPSHVSTTEFRPTALYDHPLTGGEITLVGLFLTPRAFVTRYLYFAVLFLGLIAFGGRVAVICSFACAALYSFVVIRRKFFKRLNNCLLHGLTFLFWLFAGGVILAGVLASGLAGRIFVHLYWDASAQVRVSQWSILNKLTESQLLFGTSRNDVISLVEPLWLSRGVEVIENCWLLMFIYLGAIGFVIFILGLALLFRWIWKPSDLQGKILAVAVLTAASTSNSFGRKSCLLTILVGAIAAMRESPSAPRSASREKTFYSGMPIG